MGTASMKALPKRKGNPVMEDHARVCSVEASMKAPPKKKGNLERGRIDQRGHGLASMKALPIGREILVRVCSPRRPSQPQ